MSDFNFSAVESFQTAMANGIAEAAVAFSRTFDGADVSITAGQSGAFDFLTLPVEYKAPGLLLLPCFEGKAAGILIPKSTGLVPDWCDAPDATGQSKLTTLAQEWGMSFFPDDFFPDDFHASVVPNLGSALFAGKIGDLAGYITLEIKKGSGETVDALFVWPLEDPQAALDTTNDVDPGTNTVESPGKPPAGSELEAALGTRGQQAFRNGFVPFGSHDLYSSDDKHVTVDDLPGYAKSLLKVKIPVAAVLARGKRPIKMILELGVGSVVQFDKSFDSFLDLQVGQMNVGTGEAVKVGDKFGIRIHSIRLPKERFRPIEVRKEGEYGRKKRASAIIGKAPIRTLENGK